MNIRFVLNGRELRVDVPGDRRVVDLLREDFGLTGTKEGCGSGECGACTILVDGFPRLSCLMLAAQLEGRNVTTIEGIAPGETLHPVQAAFVAHGAVQCGFCTPGMVITAVDLLNRKPVPSRADIVHALSGNLCRCTGYQKIVDAVEEVDLRTAENFSVADETLTAPPVPSRRKDGRAVFMPETFDSLWEMAAEHPNARFIAGGTDLLVWIRSGKVTPLSLICLERLAALQGISETAEGVAIGAGTSHAAILESDLIGRLFPVLTQALSTLGSPHIRRMGTIGGNIVTASPAGDTLPPLYILDARVRLRSIEEERILPISSFILGPGKTALKPGEILTSIIIPKPENGLFHHFEKVGLRNALACSVCSLAALIGVSGSGVIEKAALAWGSVGPTVMRLPEVEVSLIGKPLTQEALTDAMPQVRKSVSPIDDIRAGAEYRRMVAGNLLLRLPQVFYPDVSPMVKERIDVTRENPI